MFVREIMTHYITLKIDIEDIPIRIIELAHNLSKKYPKLSRDEVLSEIVGEILSHMDTVKVRN